MRKAASHEQAPGGPELSRSSIRRTPPQGQWREQDFFALDINHLLELSDGVLEVLPMPTESHQLRVAHLYGALLAFVTPRKLGQVLFAALPVRLWPGKIREPDVVFMLQEHRDRRTDQCWQGADLVMEVVSPDDPARDLQVKRDEYARAGIAECWIVNPLAATIRVLTLQGSSYAVRGEFCPGEMASSALLQGFEVDVAAALAARD